MNISDDVKADSVLHSGKKIIYALQSILPACVCFSAVIWLATAVHAQTANNQLKADQSGTVSVEFPPNRLGEAEFIPKPDDAEQRQHFEQVIDDAARPYLKIAAENKIFMVHPLELGKIYPAKFVVDEASKNWTSTKVNAGADQIPPNHPKNPSPDLAKWTIYMYGGLFRRPEISLDGFALVVCHEIGHLFGGFYFYTAHWTGRPVGLSAEGEADYFSTQACLRRLWEDDGNEPPYVGPFDKLYEVADIPKPIVEKCNRERSSARDRNLCYRSSMAGVSVASLWGALSKDAGWCGNLSFPWPCEPDAGTPDESETQSTLQVHHPNPQCRLDTYLAGAYCDTEFMMPTAEKVVPGTFDGFPENSLRARDEAFAQSCFTAKKVSEGARPRCWFSPDDVQR